MEYEALRTLLRHMPTVHPQRNALNSFIFTQLKPCRRPQRRRGAPLIVLLLYGVLLYLPMVVKHNVDAPLPLHVYFAQFAPGWTQQLPG